VLKVRDLVLLAVDLFVVFLALKHFLLKLGLFLGPLQSFEHFLFFLSPLKWTY